MEMLALFLQGTTVTQMFTFLKCLNFRLYPGYVTSELGDSYAIGLFVSIVNWLDGATGKFYR